MIDLWRLVFSAIAPALVLFLVFFLLGAVLKSIAAKYPHKFPPPRLYRRRQAFLSPAELSFFQVLTKVVEPDFRVCCKVRLCDIIEPHATGQLWWTLFNSISQKHVDFLLCDGKTGEALGVIELDDSSHQWPDRRERDAFVNNALAQGGIPIVHTPVKTAYQLGEIERLILLLFPETAAKPIHKV